MGWLLNAAYLLVALAAIPLATWRYLVRGKPTAGCWQKLTGQTRLPRPTTKTIWLHAVSVGEVNLLANLVPRLEKRWQDCSFVVSTTTWTGYELAQRRFGPERTFFFPWDFTWSVANALRQIQPVLIVLAELEVWPNFLRATQQHDISVAIVNGRLSERSFRGYRRFSFLLGRSFRRLAWVGAQNSEYAARFAALGLDASRVTVTGNLKFDGTQSDRSNHATQKLAALAGISPELCVWLAGSTQDPEEQIAIDVYQSLRQQFGQLRLILAPRHPERCPAIIEAIRRHGLKPIRRSQLDAPLRLDADHVLVIDTVGELAAWWGVAQIAFVGGSLGDRGGQNMLEPASYGLAVCFGPNTRNFRDVVSMLVEGDAARVIRDAGELKSFVVQCLTDVAERVRLGERARSLVQSQRGASERTMDELSRLLPSSNPIDNDAANRKACDATSVINEPLPKAG